MKKVQITATYNSVTYPIFSGFITSYVTTYPREAEDVKLDHETLTWMAIDLSPDRKHAALVAAQRIDEKFRVVLLATFSNPVNIDDKQMANQIAEWVRKYPVETVAYSRQTSGAVATALVTHFATRPENDLDIMVG